MSRRAARRPAAGPDRAGRARQVRGPAAYLRATAAVAVATAVASGARAVLHVPDVDMLYLLAVTVVAASSTRGPSIFAAALSVAAYDFFFVAPAYTFEVEDARYILTFAMMLGIGVVISNLTFRLREQERAAVARERRTSALYDASRGFGAAAHEAAVAAVCASAAGEALGAPTVLLARGPGGELAALAATPPATSLSAEELEVARWTLAQGSAAGAGAGPYPEARVACLPLRAAVEVGAVLAVRPPAGERLRPEQRDFLEALCRQGALALERVRLAAEARAASLRAEAERLRSSLLSSVSHDLRTPLATITGAATTLRDGGTLEEPTRRELVEAICDEAERLDRLVRNLLDMTRLESGAVQLRRVWVPLEEVIGGALTRLEGPLAGRPLTIACAADLPLVSIDPVLLEQLFVNVLENAAKYTPPRSPIEITAALRGEGMLVEISDRGPGIAAGMEERVFERFRRGDSGAPGFGLGLAISRAIAQAHGGALTAENRGGGGATFRLVLPLADNPPAGVPPEEPA